MDCIGVYLQNRKKEIKICNISRKSTANGRYVEILFLLIRKFKI